MDGEDSRQNPSGQGAGAGGAIIGAMTRFGKAVGLVRGGSHEEEDDRHGVSKVGGISEGWHEIDGVSLGFWFVLSLNSP